MREPVLANEKKKRLRVNLFDAIIIVLVLLVAVVGYMILGGSGDESAASTITATYTLRLNDLPEGTSELIRPGESMKENTQNTSIGTVVSVEAIPCYVDSYDPETGKVASAALEGRETVLVTLEMEAIDSATGLTSSGGFTLRVGSLVDAASPMVASANGSIVRVERVEK